jgi:hypothetical protein
VISWVKSSKLAPVDSRTLAMLSVEGQRGRPSPVTRFDLLNEVGSRPALLASPDAERPQRRASASMAFHTFVWVSLFRGSEPVV